MDKQKQIEEIARYCCNACEFGNGIDLENNIYPCALDNEYKACRLALEIAEKIYAAGYRKQRYGEWKLGESGYIYFCSCCGHTVLAREEEDWNFCSHCGAKMEVGDRDA